MSTNFGAAALLLGISATLFATVLWPFWVRFWHDFANRVGVSRPIPLSEPWVIDGDTIHDLATGVRYRLANIDAPETGDKAKCFRENERGLAAKRAAIGRVRAATQVCVRRTFRTDHHGRRVAFVEIDGRDLGEYLVQRGLAVRWEGRRRKWCGPNGGLARIAASGGQPHACIACKNWR